MSPGVLLWPPNLDTLILLFLIIFLSDYVGFYLECNGDSAVLLTDPDEGGACRHSHRDAGVGTEAGLILL